MTVVAPLVVPEVPVTVTGYVPGTAVLLALKVRFVVMLLTVANAAVTPDGTPDAAMLTFLTRPIGLTTVMAVGRFQAFSPGINVKMLAEDERLKLGGGPALTMVGRHRTAAKMATSQGTLRSLNEQGF